MGVFKRGLLFVNILLLPVLILIMFYMVFFNETIFDTNSLFNVVFDTTKLDYHYYYFGFSSLNSFLLDFGRTEPNIIDVIKGYWEMFLNNLALGLPRLFESYNNMATNIEQAGKPSGIDYLFNMAQYLYYFVGIFFAPFRYLGEGIRFAILIVRFISNNLTIIGRLIGGYYNTPLPTLNIVSVTPLLSRILGV